MKVDCWKFDKALRTDKRTNITNSRVASRLKRLKWPNPTDLIDLSDLNNMTELSDVIYLTDSTNKTDLTDLSEHTYLYDLTDLINLTNLADLTDQADLLIYFKRFHKWYMGKW